jgi:hypothetical protein
VNECSDQTSKICRSLNNLECRSPNTWECTIVKTTDILCRDPSTTNLECRAPVFGECKGTSQSCICTIIKPLDTICNDASMFCKILLIGYRECRDANFNCKLIEYYDHLCVADPINNDFSCKNIISADKIC